VGVQSCLRAASMGQNVGVSELYVGLVEAASYYWCLGAAPRPRAEAGRCFVRNGFCAAWSLPLSMVRSTANQQLQPAYFSSTEAPAKGFVFFFCPVGSNDSAPKDHTSSGRCQTCLSWKWQLSMESATCLRRSSCPWRVFCCQMSSCLEPQVSASS